VDEKVHGENMTLRDECPLLAAAAEHTDRIREERTAFFLKETGRLQGLENFLTFMATTRAWLQSHDDLKTITILLGWIEADFYTAIDATLRGFHSVAFDAMRDEMEIEILLSEFAANPSQIERWLTCSHDERKNLFGHGGLRKRKAARLGIEVEDLPDRNDYLGHSLFLHVNPVQNPFGGRGIAKVAVEHGADACFWDIYLHARNLIRTLTEIGN
jgi:hypothetical protein